MSGQMSNAVRSVNRSNDILEQLDLEELGIKIILQVIQLLKDEVYIIPSIPNFSEND